MNEQKVGTKPELFSIVGTTADLGARPCLSVASTLSPILLFFLAFLLFASQLEAQSSPVTLTTSGDTFLRQGLPNQNQGTEKILQVRALGNNRALVQFDQTEIVTKSTLSSAKLRLFFGEDAPAVSNQHSKGLEGFRGEWNDLLTLGHHSFSDVQVKWTELKQHTELRRLRDFKRSLIGI